MLRRLRKLWFEMTSRLKRPTPMEFAYWDGSHVRRVNPRRPAWIIDSGMPNPFDADNDQHCSRALRVIRQAFKLSPCDPVTGHGLCDVDAAKLYGRFLRYTDAVCDGSHWWNRTEPESTGGNG